MRECEREGRGRGLREREWKSKMGREGSRRKGKGPEEKESVIERRMVSIDVSVLADFEF